MQTQIPWDLALCLWAAMGVGRCCKKKKERELVSTVSTGCGMSFWLTLEPLGSQQRAAEPLR